MGCWNETCLISNLPITHREEVIVSIVEKSTWGPEHTPICLPVVGKYDDYGSIENFDESSLAFKYIMKHFGNNYDGNNIFSDIAGGGFTNQSTRYAKETQVGLVMMLKDIVEPLIKSLVRRKIIPTDEIKSRINLMSEQNKSPINFKNKTNLSENDRKMLSELIDIRLGGISSIVGIDMLNREEYLDITKFAISLGACTDDAVLDEFIAGIQLRSDLEHVIGTLRKSWAPTLGTGSQQRDYRTHLVLANEIKRHIFDSFQEPEQAYGSLSGVWND